MVEFLAKQREKEEAGKAYGYLIHDTNKTLEDVIKAIVNYEYFESPESKTVISQIPKAVVDENKKEYLRYIEKRLNK